MAEFYAEYKIRALYAEKYIVILTQHKCDQEATGGKARPKKRKPKKQKKKKPKQLTEERNEQHKPNIPNIPNTSKDGAAPKRIKPTNQQQNHHPANQQHPAAEQTEGQFWGLRSRILFQAHTKQEL